MTHVTVDNYLKGDHQYPYHRRKQPRLSDDHKARRVAFAEEYQDSDWLRTLMTDETEVSLGQKPNSKNDIIWAPKGADVTPVDVDQYPRTLRFWAGASAKGRTKLHFFNHNLDGNAYRQILTDALPEFTKIFGSRPWVFQHDGAPEHRAKKTNDWLRTNVPQFISSGPEGTWPPYSPDLNWRLKTFGAFLDRSVVRE